MTSSLSAKRRISSAAWPRTTTDRRVTLAALGILDGRFRDLAKELIGTLADFIDLIHHRHDFGQLGHAQGDQFGLGNGVARSTAAARAFSLLGEPSMATRILLKHGNLTWYLYEKFLNGFPKLRAIRYWA